MVGTHWRGTERRNEAGHKASKKKNTPSKEAIDFFLKNAGGIVGKEKEYATDLARAEKYAEDHGWTVQWEEDPNGVDWDLQSDESPEDYEVLSALLRDSSGNVLASIGGVSFLRRSSQSRKYGRVVEAELALEAMDEKR